MFTRLQSLVRDYFGFSQRESRGILVLLFLTLLFGVLLNFPLLGAFSHDIRLAGIPVLYLYVLAVWATLVALTGWLVKGIKN